MATPNGTLDDQELLHLAIRASNENHHEEAIRHLKQAIDLAPMNAKAYYMLGAEHAEIGMFDRAVEEMAKAVKLDPSLITASFQLGLLHITSGRVAEAKAAWQPLDKLGDNNPIYLFKKGMLDLAEDKFDDARQALEKGISLNKANEALNVDMRRMLEKIMAAQQKTSSIGAAASGKGATEGKPSTHVLVSTYRQNREDNDKDQ